MGGGAGRCSGGVGGSKPFWVGGARSRDRWWGGICIELVYGNYPSYLRAGNGSSGEYARRILGRSRRG